MKRISRKTLVLMLIFIGSVYYSFLPQSTITTENPITLADATQNDNKSVSSEIFTIKEDDKQIQQENSLVEYIEIVDGCNSYFVGECINVRSGPGREYDVVTRLRNGIVLKMGEKVTVDGEEWYRIKFDEWLRYEDRVSDSWYVSAEYTRPFLNEGNKELGGDGISTSTKHIVVDRSEQKLYAYEGNKLFMEESVSTGLEKSPTPRGLFHIYKKTPSRYMQGPILGISEKEYDLPGVPWNLYFTEDGAVIHGAYWHDKFGQQWSNGCVNLSPEKAKKLYLWADLGMEILVRD